MDITTLCYIEKDNKYLMLHRTKKKEDINEGKWLGVGGHFEQFEDPYECVKREVKEETGLDIIKCKLRGMVTFVADREFDELIFIFTVSEFVGNIIECNEGNLSWIDKKDVYSLNMWEGDRIFLRLLEEDREFFSVKLEYDKDKVVYCSIDGEKIGENIEDFFEKYH